MPVHVSAIHAEAVSGAAGRNLRLMRAEQGPSLGKDQVAVWLLAEESLAELQRRCSLPAETSGTVRAGDLIHPLTEDRA